MSAITFLKEIGVSVSVSDTGKLKLSGLSRLRKDQAKTAVEYARKSKGQILAEISAICESCPAGGYWDWKGSGLWCFHGAYFLGKATKPKPCRDARQNCPLSATDECHIVRLA